MENFSIQHTTPDGRPDIAVLRLEGEMDSQVITHVESVVNPLMENPAVSAIVFDMSKLIYMNSRAVGLMMNFYGILKERNRSLVFAGLQDGVQDTLSLVGVTQLVPVFDTVDAYVASTAAVQA